MEIFQKVAKGVSKTYKATTKQTEKFAQKMKLNSILSENQEKIDDLYQEIGKIIYQKHILATDPQEKIIAIEEELINECSKIDSLADEIADTRKELLKLRHQKQCPHCYGEFSLDAKFCPYCGVRQNQYIFQNEEKQENE